MTTARGERPLVVAHRGSSAALPEHTRAAYEKAVQEGADGLECDVRLTADGELVCLHDRTLARTGGSDRVVSTTTLAELRAVDWGAWRHADATEQADPPSPAGRVDGDGDLMTLRELVELALAAPRPTGLAIETKHPTRFGGRVEHEVAALLTEYGLDAPRADCPTWVRMMSFSSLAVRRMSGLLPHLPTVMLAGQPEPPYLRGGGLLGGARTAGLDLEIMRRHPEVVAMQHDAGHEVFVWTVDEDEDIALVLDLGVDAVISNRPDRVQVILDSGRLNG